MLRLLIKKELAELISSVLRKNANKNKVSKNNVILYAVIFIVLFAVMSLSFAGTAYLFCEQLCNNGLTWLYFALMGLMSLLFGTLGSAFTAYSTLYKAKDNELLLSMPIPHKGILLSRLITIYITGLVFSAFMVVPTFIVYFILIKFDLAILLCSIVVMLVLPLLSLIISCLLGWIIAWVFSYIKSSQILIMFLSILFLVIYFYVGTVLLSTENIMNNINNLDIYLRKYLFIFYELGLGQSGDPIHLFIFSIIVIGLFLVEYYILSKSFIRLVTTNLGNKKIKYKSKGIKVSKPFNALLKKELKRFTSSSTYMLNGGLGIIMMLIMSIMLIINGNKITSIFQQLGLSNDLIPIIAFAVMTIVASMNYITAPSISLEGNNIWIYQSLPISTIDIFKAKIALHMLIVGPVAFISSIFVVIGFNLSIEYYFIFPILTCIFVLMCAMFGLVANLKHPNLDWNNETVPIKQGLSVLLALFVPWIFIMLVAAGYVLVYKVLYGVIYFVILFVIFLAIIYLMYKFLLGKGKTIFNNL